MVGSCVGRPERTVAEFVGERGAETVASGLDKIGAVKGEAVVEVRRSVHVYLTISFSQCHLNRPLLTAHTISFSTTSLPTPIPYTAQTSLNIIAPTSMVNEDFIALFTTTQKRYKKSKKYRAAT
jgi:hypothetical protein